MYAAYEFLMVNRNGPKHDIDGNCLMFGRVFVYVTKEDIKINKNKLYQLEIPTLVLIFYNLNMIQDLNK